LRALGVRVGDHQRHERASLGRLRARRRRLRQHRLGDFVEQRDVGWREKTRSLRGRLRERAVVEREGEQTIAADERDAADESGHVPQHVASCERHKFPRFSSSTANAAARAVSAMYVNDGFWQPDETMHAPSVTKTFVQSQTWLWPFSTEVFGSRP